MPIYETSAKYTGKVCIIHGDKDTIVPLRYGEHYHKIFPSSEFHVLEGNGHFLRNKRSILFDTTVSFLRNNLNL